MNSSQKKILFICPEFFNLHKIIQETLIKKGYQVDFIADRPFRSSLAKILLRLFRGLIIPFIDLITIKKLKKLKKNYHYIFVINGEGLSEKSLAFLKENYQDAKFVLYIWDSINNKNYLIEHFRFFDSCNTFDSHDAEKYGLNFKPLFSSFDTDNKNLIKYNQRLYDLSFIGTVHSDRLNIILKFSEYAKSHKLNLFLYCFVQSKVVFLVRKVMSIFSLKSFKLYLKGMDIISYEKLLSQSKATLEIHHPKQYGLTARSLDTLFSHTKLISTNSSLQYYDFYNPQNIFIVDRKKINLDGLRDFLNKPYKRLSPRILDHYRLDNWLDVILS